MPILGPYGHLPQPLGLLDWYVMYNRLASGILLTQLWIFLLCQTTQESHSDTSDRSHHNMQAESTVTLCRNWPIHVGQLGF